MGRYLYTLSKFLLQSPSLVLEGALEPEQSNLVGTVRGPDFCNITWELFIPEESSREAIQPTPPLANAEDQVDERRQLHQPQATRPPPGRFEDLESQGREDIDAGLTEPVYTGFEVENRTQLAARAFQYLLCGRTAYLTRHGISRRVPQ